MSESVTSTTDVSKRLVEHGLMIEPSAAELLIDSSADSETVLDIVPDVCDEKTVTESDVERAIESFEEESEDTHKEPSPNEQEETSVSNTTTTVKGDEIDPQTALERLSEQKQKTENAEKVINRKETLPERYPDLCETLFDRELPEVAERNNFSEGYTVTGDVTGRSRSTGQLDDFQNMFSDRHDRLVDILSQRVRAQKISQVDKRRHSGKEMTVAGLVWSKFTNDNDNYFIELEGVNSNEHFRAIFTDPEIQDTFDEVIEDEVIAVEGTITDDGDAIFGNEIHFPEVPRRTNRKRPDNPIKAALISDIHVGAEEFYAEKWNRFVDYVRTTPELEYVFVAGDIVEGIGVYPDQDEELTILDIHDQYAIAARMFEQFPDDVQVISSVGNHDRVRLAEPQPTLSDEFASYFSENVDLVGNPVTVNVDGVTVLMYHGMSINALAESVPGISVDPPTDTMELMLRKRHLAPVYGKNVRFAPEDKDYLVIDEVPDILHCGHVHKYGAEEYKGTKILNTATWQGQTSFQKSKGIEPDTGYFSIVTLSNMEVTTKSV